MHHQRTITTIWELNWLAYSLETVRVFVARMKFWWIKSVKTKIWNENQHKKQQSPIISFEKNGVVGRDRFLGEELLLLIINFHRRKGGSVWWVCCWFLSSPFWIGQQIMEIDHYRLLWGMPSLLYTCLFGWLVVASSSKLQTYFQLYKFLIPIQLLASSQTTSSSRRIKIKKQEWLWRESTIMKCDWWWWCMQSMVVAVVVGWWCRVGSRPAAPTSSCLLLLETIDARLLLLESLPGECVACGWNELYIGI